MSSPSFYLCPLQKSVCTLLISHQEIHAIPVKDGINSKGSAFCTVSSMQVARAVIAELDGQYMVPGFGSVAPVNVKVQFLSQSVVLRMPTL